MNEHIKSEIKIRLRSSIEKFFRDKTVKTHHVLDLIFPEERRVRSLIGGLETSLGIVWEAIALALAESNGFKILNKEDLKMPTPFPEVLAKELFTLEQLRVRRETWISMDECVARLREVAQHVNRGNLEYVAPPPGHAVDVYLLKDGIEYAFDLKTVQPNAGDGKRFNLQLLNWYAYRFCDDPNANFEARIAFPFSPSSRSWWDFKGSSVFPLVREEVSVFAENEFWNFCSGHSGTWEEIYQLFIELGQEGFGRQFDNIFYPNPDL